MKLKKVGFKFYILCFLFSSIAINWGIYITIVNKYNDIFLKSYLSSVEKYFEYDFQYMDNLELDKNQILLLQNDSQVKNARELRAIEQIIGSKFLYYEKSSRYILVDIQELKEILDEILPLYINYQISFNGNVVNLDNKMAKKLEEKSYFIGNKLLINLSLNEKINYVINNKELLRQIVFTPIIINLVFIVIITAFFIKKYKRFNQVIKQLKYFLHVQRTLVLKFINAKKAKHKIDTLFIKRTTEMYASDELKEVENNNELKIRILENIGAKEYIFPLTLKGFEKLVIQTEEFFFDLVNSIDYYMFNSDLKINILSKTLNIECHKEVFYQILLSLIVNLMKFVENQSDKKKLITINIYENKIAFLYDGYKMSRDNMIKLSNHMSPMHIDMFLLTCNKLFQSIDYHGMRYNITSRGFQNTIELFYCQDSQRSKPLNAKIIEFQSKKKDNKKKASKG